MIMGEKESNICLHFNILNALLTSLFSYLFDKCLSHITTHNRSYIYELTNAKIVLSYI